MQDRTRRAFLQGSAAAAAGAAVTIPAVATLATNHPDAGLLDLERHLVAEEARFDREADDLSREDFDARSEEIFAIELRLSEMPAVTADGIAVKLRRLQAYFPGETVYDRTNFQRAFEALLRLSVGTS